MWVNMRASPWVPRIQTIFKPCKGGTIGEPRAMLRLLAEILTHAVRRHCFALSGRYPVFLASSPRELPWAVL